MSWNTILRKWNFLSAIEDVMYRLDWRKPNKESVRLFLNDQVGIAHQLFHEGLLPKYGGTRDDKALKCRKWVTQLLGYEGDRFRFKVAEKWQTILETLAFKKGDCEDGAVLLYCLLIVNGINPLQVSLCTGNVYTPKGPAGHCWVEYWADQYFLEEGWCTMDWCYYPNTIPFQYRVPKNRKLYLTKWWEISYFPFK